MIVRHTVIGGLLFVLVAWSLSKIGLFAALGVGTNVVSTFPGIMVNVKDRTTTRKTGTKSMVSTCPGDMAICAKDRIPVLVTFGFKDTVLVRFSRRSGMCLSACPEIKQDCSPTLALKVSRCLVLSQC